MKRALLIIFTFFTTLFCYGQKEHLEPVKDLSQYEGVLKNYYDSVFVLLYKGFSEKPTARYTCMPSFSNEYAFSVEEKNGQYFIISNGFSKSYWSSKDRQPVKVISSLTEIEVEFYEAIKDLFQLLAAQTKINENNIKGLDGSFYYFSTLDSSGEIKTGETWSPDKKSILNRLVKICDKIYFLGQGKALLETDIEISVKDLIADLEK